MYQDRLKEIDELKSKIDTFSPLSKDINVIMRRY